MDATTGSSGSGFDAALRALEDLETSVAQAREDNLAPVAIEPAPAPAVAPIAEAPLAAIAPAIAAEPISASSDAIAFSDDQAPAAVITAVPVTEIADIPAALTPEAPVEPHPAPVSLSGAAFVSAPAAPVLAAAPVADPVAHPVEAPAAVAPAQVAKPSASPRGAMLGKVAIGLGLVSSLISAVGLVIAERTITSAQLVVATARERQEQLETANRLVHDLQLVRDKQIELLKAQQAQLTNAPVTSDELQHRMESLQAGLLARDPLTEVVLAVREGQAMTNARLNVFEKKMDRVEAVMNGR